MLNMRIDHDYDVYIEFECPKCGNYDAVYIVHPSRCYGCNQKFNFDAFDLREGQDARVKFFLNGNKKC